MSIQLGYYLGLSALLFTLGAAGFLFRRNGLVALMAIEIMLNAANLVLVAANRWGVPVPLPEATEGATGFVTQSTLAHPGQVFAFFVIAVAAAEAAVGLAIIVSFYRLGRTVRTDAADQLKG